MLYAQNALAAGQTVNISFDEQVGPGYYAAVDTDNRLQQVGWQREPSLMHLAWAAQWLQYRANLSTRLDSPALVIPIFEQKVRCEAAMQHWSNHLEKGIRVTLTEHRCGISFLLVVCLPILVHALLSLHGLTDEGDVEPVEVSVLMSHGGW